MNKALKDQGNTTLSKFSLNPAVAIEIESVTAALSSVVGIEALGDRMNWGMPSVQTLGLIRLLPELVKKKMS